MGSVGIVANPAASKDVRRVVSQAATVSNHEKSNTVRRVLLGLAATAVAEVWYLPDSAGIVRHAADRLDLPFRLLPLEGDWRGTAADTTAAAARLAELGAACLVTLGGDGTARAAARGSRDLPLLALSTGTNNAFPIALEGTLAGLAAGAFALGRLPARRAPLLEVLRAGEEPSDLALVDVAAVADTLGGRAVWEVERLLALVTTRTRPGTVGLSAIGGHLGAEFAASMPAGTVAVAATLGETGHQIRAPIAPGLLAAVGVIDHAWLGDGATCDLPDGCALALDGERELMARPGERWQVRAVAAGVPIVDVEQALVFYATHSTAVQRA